MYSSLLEILQTSDSAVSQLLFEGKLMTAQRPPKGVSAVPALWLLSLLPVKKTGTCAENPTLPYKPYPAQEKTPHLHRKKPVPAPHVGHFKQL